MSAQITITVRLFAQLRQAAGGTSTLERVVTDGAPAGDVAAAVLADLGMDGLAGHIVLAIDGEFADPSAPLEDGAWLSLVPPVSGGAPGAGAPIDVRVTEAPLDAGAALSALADPAAGGTVVFQGTPRDVDALDFEAHHELAERELRRIGEQLVAEHGLTGVALHHRFGRVPSGEAALIVVAAAPHRGPAFAAARGALDVIKERVPIWKSEVRGDQLSAVEGQTVTGVRTLADHAAAAAGVAGSPALTHVGADGEARMVDVTTKAVTDRVAKAAATVVVSPQTAQLIADGNGPKGEVIGVARLAGIMAAKQTAAIVPLAHPLPLTKIDVDASVDTVAGIVHLTSMARTTGRTGVEIEALTAVLVAALTIYDMVKAVERHARIEGVHVTEKRGGRHDFAADGDGEPAAPAPVPDPAQAAQTAHCGDAPRSLTLAAITVSTTRTSGRRPDAAATALGDFARRLGWDVVSQAMVTDDRAAIARAIREAAGAQPAPDVVLTLGGTGITTDDVTPEATREVIGREIPGISEAIRAASREVTPLAALSRGVVGELDGRLVVNLPGSPKALGELEPLLAAILPHAVSQLRRAEGASI